MWINQLCTMHSFSSLKSITRTSPMPSSTSICAYLVFPLKFLTAPTNLTIWSGWISFKINFLHFQKAEWIIFAVTVISVCSPLFKAPFETVVLDCFLSLMIGSSSTNWLSSSSFFFLTWCDKQCCQTWLHSSNGGQCFFEWGSFLRRAHCYQNQWNTALNDAAILSKMQTSAITLWLLNTASKNKIIWVTLFKKNNLLAKLCFS